MCKMQKCQKPKKKSIDDMFENLMKKDSVQANQKGLNKNRFGLNSYQIYMLILTKYGYKIFCEIVLCTNLNQRKQKGKQTLPTLQKKKKYKTKKASNESKITKENICPQGAYMRKEKP